MANELRRSRTLSNSPTAQSFKSTNYPDPRNNDHYEQSVSSNVSMGQDLPERGKVLRAMEEHEYDERRMNTVMYLQERSGSKSSKQRSKENRKEQSTATDVIVSDAQSSPAHNCSVSEGIRHIKLESFDRKSTLDSSFTRIASIIKLDDNQYLETVKSYESNFSVANEQNQNDRILSESSKISNTGDSIGNIGANLAYVVSNQVSHFDDNTTTYSDIDPELRAHPPPLIATEAKRNEKNLDRWLSCQERYRTSSDIPRNDMYDHEVIFPSSTYDDDTAIDDDNSALGKSFISRNTGASGLTGNYTSYTNYTNDNTFNNTYCTNDTGTFFTADDVETLNTNDYQEIRRLLGEGDSDMAFNSSCCIWMCGQDSTEDEEERIDWNKMPKERVSILTQRSSDRYYQHDSCTEDDIAPFTNVCEIDLTEDKSNYRNKRIIMSDVKKSVTEVPIPLRVKEIIERKKLSSNGHSKCHEGTSDQDTNFTITTDYDIGEEASYQSDPIAETVDQGVIVSMESGEKDVTTLSNETSFKSHVAVKHEHEVTNASHPVLTTPDVNEIIHDLNNTSKTDIAHLKERHDLGFIADKNTLSAKDFIPESKIEICRELSTCTQTASNKAAIETSHDVTPTIRTRSLFHYSTLLANKVSSNNDTDIPTHSIPCESQEKFSPKEKNCASVKASFETIPSQDMEVSEWREYRDDRTGKKFYYNGVISTWKRPIGFIESNGNGNVVSKSLSTEVSLPRPEKEKPASHWTKLPTFFSLKNPLKKQIRNKCKNSQSVDKDSIKKSQVSLSSKKVKVRNKNTKKTSNSSSANMAYKKEASNHHQRSVTSSSTTIQSQLPMKQESQPEDCSVSTCNVSADNICTDFDGNISLTMQSPSPRISIITNNNNDDTSEEIKTVQSKEIEKKKRKRWREYTDPNSGNKYYSNGDTTTWIKPAEFCVKT